MEIVYKAKRQPEIVIKLRPRRNSKVQFCECTELKGKNFSLAVFHSTMSAPPAAPDNYEKTPLKGGQEQSQGILSSTIAKLQIATRGNLVLLTACMFLIIAAGVLLFPQKTWNRIMLKLFGCATFNVNGHQYKLCEDMPQPEHVQLF